MRGVAGTNEIKEQEEIKLREQEQKQVKLRKSQQEQKKLKKEERQQKEQEEQQQQLAGTCRQLPPICFSLIKLTLVQRYLAVFAGEHRHQACLLQVDKDPVSVQLSFNKRGCGALCSVNVKYSNQMYEDMHCTLEYTLLCFIYHMLLSTR